MLTSAGRGQDRLLSLGATVRSQDEIERAGLYTLLFCLTPLEVMTLLVSLSKSHISLANFLVSALQIEARYFKAHQSGKNLSTVIRDFQDGYKAVRDYYLLKALSDRLARSKHGVVCLDKLNSFSDTLFLTKAIQASPHELQAHKQFDQEIWEKVLRSVSEDNQKNLSQYKEQLNNKLAALSPHESKQPDIEAQSARIHSVVAEQTVVVVTFDTDLLNLNKETVYKNFLTRKSRGVDLLGSEECLVYASRRIHVETILYSSAQPHHLFNFLMNTNAHPCFGTLQFLSHVEPIKRYGKSFFVLDSSVKAMSTALFGTPFTKIFRKDTYCRPVKLNESLTPLIAQFSSSLLTSLAADNLNDLSKHYDMQYKEEETEYIEVHFPANYPLNDAKYIKHIHFNFSRQFLQDAVLTKLLNNGIAITLGKNPFKDPRYLQAFQANNIESFLIDLISDYIYKAALFLGETTSNNLQCVINKDFIKFDFNITLNSPSFHQAQAAGLLYLLGVRRIFSEKMSAIGFVEEKLDYQIPLNDTKRDLGEIDDHDAYSYQSSSLRKLLNIFLKRIFTVIVVNYQNECYLKEHHRPHPETGLGATDESNLTKDISSCISGPKGAFNFVVNWLYDSVVIEVLSAEESNILFIIKSISAVIASSIRSVDNFIHIDLPLPILLSQLEKKRYPYQACIIYEDNIADSQYGNLFLAFRYSHGRGHGYSAPGGHNNDPYSWAGVFNDVEFGQVKFSEFDLSNIEMLSFTNNPATIYYSIGSSHLYEMKEDVSEFKQGSLDQFPVYSLGNLTSEQIKKVSQVFGISEEEYNNAFGRALPLRRLLSIYVFLHHCEKAVKKKLSEAMNTAPNTKPLNFSVKINVDHTNKKYNNTHYWLPTVNFGEIRIEGDKDSLLFLHGYFKEYFRCLIELKSNETVLLLQNVNPQRVIALLSIQSLASNDNCGYGLLLLKNKASDILNQLPVMTIVDILSKARKIKKGRPSIVKALGPHGSSIFLRMIREFIKQSNSIPAPEQKAEEKPILSQELFTLKNIINILMPAKWQPNKRNIFHTIVLEDHLDLLEFVLTHRDFKLLAYACDSSKKNPLNYLLICSEAMNNMLGSVSKKLKEKNLRKEVSIERVKSILLETLPSLFSCIPKGGIPALTMSTAIVSAFFQTYFDFDLRNLKIEVNQDTNFYNPVSPKKVFDCLLETLLEFIKDEETANTAGALLKSILESPEQNKDLILSKVLSMPKGSQDELYKIFLQNVVEEKPPTDAPAEIKIESSVTTEAKDTISNFLQAGESLFSLTTANSTHLPEALLESQAQTIAIGPSLNKNTKDFPSLP